MLNHGNAKLFELDTQCRSSRLSASRETLHQVVSTGSARYWHEQLGIRIRCDMLPSARRGHERHVPRVRCNCGDDGPRSRGAYSIQNCAKPCNNAKDTLHTILSLGARYFEFRPVYLPNIIRKDKPFPGVHCLSHSAILGRRCAEFCTTACNS